MIALCLKILNNQEKCHVFYTFVQKILKMKTVVIDDRIEMENIINECQICHVGISEMDGSPYVIPMNFAFYEGTIVLHSGPFGKHLNLLAQDARVCVSFCQQGELVYQHEKVACSYRMDGRSVICKGEVVFVDNLEEKEKLLNIFMTKYSDQAFNYSQPALRNVKVWTVKVTEMTAKAFGQPHWK